MSKSRIAWNITNNNVYKRYWLSLNYECEVYKFIFKSLKEPKWKYVYQFMIKRTISGSKLILHKHFGVCKSFFILDLSN